MSDIYNEIITILTKRAKIRAMALLKSTIIQKAG